MRRYRAPLGPSVTFFAFRSWAGCITNTSEFDLRQAQDSRTRPFLPNPLISREQRWFRDSNQPAQEGQNAVECPPIRRLQQSRGAHAWSIEDRLLLAERVKAPFAVIGAHAGCADAAERLVLLRDV